MPRKCETIWINDTTKIELVDFLGEYAASITIFDKEDTEILYAECDQRPTSTEALANLKSRLELAIESLTTLKPHLSPKCELVLAYIGDNTVTLDFAETEGVTYCILSHDSSEKQITCNLREIHTLEENGLIVNNGETLQATDKAL